MHGWQSTHHNASAASYILAVFIQETDYLSESDCSSQKDYPSVNTRRLQFYTDNTSDYDYPFLVKDF